MFEKLKAMWNSPQQVLVIRPAPYPAPELPEGSREAFIKTFKKKRDEDA